ncbi:MAG: BCAM0308 family protein [Vicinamibacterales bacterium]
MRGQKHYTNVGFTKRVDYDGGAHRPGRAGAEPAVCERCGALRLRRRWIPASDDRATVLAPSARRVVCPACRQIASGLPNGHLRLGGAWLAGHRDEVERLIHNEAERASADNPMARLMSWSEPEPGVLEVTTTTVHLVERLGHAVQRAFGGTVDYGFSHANQLARATWRRD